MIERLELWCLIKHMEGWKTDQGTWSPTKLVSIPNTSQGNSSNSPKFVGTKMTMELKPTDGTKPVVGMTRYNLLMTMKDRRGLYLDEELSLCHTYPLEIKPKGKRARAADPFILPWDEQDQVASRDDATERSPMDVDEYGVDVPDLPSTDSSKRPRPESKHWHNFTKIYTKNPYVMYGACNHCNTMLKLKDQSTSSLNNHYPKHCPCKPKQQQQLPGNSSSMPIPPIASRNN
ncbi:uncharacterized protein LOC123439172 [Hordeum vulgare subsp. vulgare]|uniref:uncharacterized protein LOC123439172 n=1 Tax=Hordeum vulgare subsp. vulgare TaxID=112509 RepID=UPI001B84EAF4|nr:uncharacterized protein LOC123439172 [Hordeum vulgare subsp. vulgare]